MSVQENAIKLSKKLEELNDTIEQTYYLEQKIFEYSKKVEANKAKISKELGKRSRFEARVDDQTMFTVSKNVNTNIEFFEDQLQAKFGKEMYNKIVNKTIVIENLPGLIKFLKRYGVDPKEFKTYLNTIKEVDVHKIDQLIEIDELKIEDLQGCYKVEFAEDIKVRKTK
jgi:NADPH-dependent 7-cyano-7-deazaguanine reductase QueF-like protein